MRYRSFWGRAVSKRAVVGYGVGAWLFFQVVDASAYCRQRTCKDRPADGFVCPLGDDGCVSEGEFLYRDSPCLAFGIDDGVAKGLGMTDAEFEDVVVEAFHSWTTVDCGGGKHPAVDVQSLGAVHVSGNYFCDLEPELNLPVWTFVSPWTNQATALGFTSSVFDKSRDVGRVFDSDVELNLDKIKGSFSLVEQRAVLLTVATHEAGHFLGLAHSQHADAVMAPTYTDTELLGRDIQPDDIDGICAIYPPEDEELECAAASYSEAALDEQACEEIAASMQAPNGEGGCSIARGQRRVALAPSALALMFGIGALRLRRSGRQRGSAASAHR